MRVTDYYKGLYPWQSQGFSWMIQLYIMDCVCQRCHKECSTRTCADDYYYCWKSPNSNHLCDHGVMDVINIGCLREVRAVITCLCIKSIFPLPDDWCINYTHGRTNDLFLDLNFMISRKLGKPPTIQALKNAMPQASLWTPNVIMKQIKFSSLHAKDKV